MVEANNAAGGVGDINIEDMSNDEFEALCRKLPKMTPEEQQESMDEWVNRPLNCKEITPEMLERPEYQALMQMAYEGSPLEV